MVVALAGNPRLPARRTGLPGARAQAPSARGSPGQRWRRYMRTVFDARRPKGPAVARRRGGRPWSFDETTAGAMAARSDPRRSPRRDAACEPSRPRLATRRWSPFGPVEGNDHLRYREAMARRGGRAPQRGAASSQPLDLRSQRPVSSSACRAREISWRSPSGGASRGCSYGGRTGGCDSISRPAAVSSPSSRNCRRSRLGGGLREDQRVALMQLARTASSILAFAMRSAVWCTRGR